MENDKSMIYITAIVAVVAVVALVMMVMNKPSAGAANLGSQTQGVTAGESSTLGTDVAGQATGSDYLSAFSINAALAALGGPTSDGPWALVVNKNTAGFSVPVNFQKKTTFFNGISILGDVSTSGNSKTKLSSIEAGLDSTGGYSSLLTDSLGTTFNKPAVFNDKAAFASSINSVQMRGSGNAYVCVDANGMMFRSNTPCR